MGVVAKQGPRASYRDGGPCGSTLVGHDTLCKTKRSLGLELVCQAFWSCCRYVCCLALAGLARQACPDGVPASARYEASEGKGQTSPIRNEDLCVVGTEESRPC